MQVRKIDWNQYGATMAKNVSPPTNEPGDYTMAPGKPREAYERRGEAGVWAVEDFGGDGECYMAKFYGPGSRERAEEYAAFKYGSSQ